MLVPLLAATIAVAPLCEAPVPALDLAPVDSALMALYAGGQTFDQFLEKAQARKRQWEENWEQSRIPADVLESARGLSRRWRLLAIAVDGCSDSVNTVPYLARLSAEVPGIELRIVSSSVAQAQMESHRTPDGRAATPTIIVIDDTGIEAGCWVERPAALQQLAIEARTAGKLDEFGRNKQAWYDKDAGASTVREVVAALVAAEGGGVRCDAKR